MSSSLVRIQGGMFGALGTPGVEVALSKKRMTQGVAAVMVARIKDKQAVKDIWVVVVFSHRFDGGNRENRGGVVGHGFLVRDG